eukprot:CAMPEP_0118977896 /NCGR_PEP_ID=MMETSP1173-20130426/22408_1 /TAXON_ID=1034831 /ORGANISM="Rhizochromulina marina cf, Strain CCMP1243" /LENGTH=59 /DNA_ID=CAMNT_0006928045 /DNA_START=44 /DNA_END=219 /DNA_ORIENTATION=-
MNSDVIPPSAVAWFASAPAASSDRTTPRCPCADATNSGLVPLSVLGWFTSALAATSDRT